MAKCRWRLDPGQIEVVDDAVAEILRQKTPSQRIAMVFAADRMIRQVVKGSIKKLHPDWSEGHVQEELARRMTRGAA
jgi:hypothetical protein